MSFICPVANAAMSPLQASAHLGLMLGVVVAGLIFLAAGAIAYRRDRVPASSQPE